MGLRDRANVLLTIGVIILMANHVTGYAQDKGGARMNTAGRLNNALKDFKSFKEKGVDPVITRYGEVDIAYPAGEEEYCILGGYAVVMIVAISGDREELPIERAYFQVSDEKPVLLDKLGVSVDGGDLLGDMVTEKKDNAERICFENISFWAIPVCWFQVDAGFIAVDFKGERKEFVILRGPWKLDSRIQECINKHNADQIKVAEHVPYDVLAKFIEREYFESNRVQF